MKMVVFGEWDLNLRIAMNSSVLSSPAALMMLCAPPGCPSKNAVPSYTSPFTTNHGFSPLSCSLNSSIEISRSTPSLVILISLGASVSNVSATSPSTFFSPQYPFVKFPPLFFTLSIQPPGISAGCVGCSNRSAPCSLCTTTLNHGLFIIPSTDQYMSLGCTFMLSSIARTTISFASFSSSTSTLIFQKHQQKHVSRQSMSSRPPKSSRSSNMRYLSSA